MIETQKKFSEMESEINDTITSIGAALVGFSILLLLIVATFPIDHLTKHGFVDYMVNEPGHFIALIVIEVLSLGGSMFIGLYLIRAKKNNKYTVIVNEKGAYILSPHGGIAEQFLYSELCPSNENFSSDINLRINSRYVTPRLILYKKGKHDTCEKQLLSFQWEYYSLKNRFELYQHFLKGVQIFRPDLKIQYIALLHFQLVGEADAGK